MLTRLALAVCLVALGAACAGDSETVARVGGEKISEEQLERVVEHFEEEFEREGREFPSDGSPEERTLEKTVLGLVVFRLQLEQAAAKLGVRVDEEEIEARLERSEEAEAEAEGEGEAGAAYLENAIRTQLIREKVAARLGGIEALNEWIAKARKEIPVDYEEGWAP